MYAYGYQTYFMNEKLENRIIHVFFMYAFEWCTMYTLHGCFKLDFGIILS